MKELLLELRKIFSRIGSIPGCYVLRYSLNDNNDQTFYLDVDVKIRTAVWHETEESWNITIDARDPSTFSTQLEAAFGQEIREQEVRFERSFEEYEDMMIVSKKDVRHLYVDKMILWIMSPIYYSPEGLMERIDSEVAVHMTRYSENGAEYFYHNGNHEVLVPLQKSQKINDLGEIMVKSNCLILPVALPETMMNGIIGRKFSEVIDLSDKWGDNLQKLIGHRTVTHAEIFRNFPGAGLPQEERTMFKLSIDAVRIKDIDNIDIDPYKPERPFW
jgi:hypothetical protein